MERTLDHNPEQTFSGKALLVSLQFAHLAFLVIVPLLYALLRNCSEPYDTARHAIDVGIVSLAAAWTGLVAVSTAVYGKGDTVKERLLSAYREFLQRMSFLIVSNVLLGIACGFLLYQLVGFRQVEFYSENQTVLTLNDKPGDLRELGIMTAKVAQNFRLALGRRHLVFSDPTTKEPLYSAIVTVPPIWRVWEIERVTVPKPSRGTYEATKP